MNEFFASIYEELYYEPAFSQAVYQFDLCSVIGIVNIIIPLAFAFLYYKIVDRPNFANVVTWFIFGVIGAVVNLAATYGILVSALSSSYDFGHEYFGLSKHTAWIALVLYILYSFLFKRISINSKNIPF